MPLTSGPRPSQGVTIRTRWIWRDPWNHRRKDSLDCIKLRSESLSIVPSMSPKRDQVSWVEFLACSCIRSTLLHSGSIVAACWEHFLEGKFCNGVVLSFLINRLCQEAWPGGTHNNFFHCCGQLLENLCQEWVTRWWCHEGVCNSLLTIRDTCPIIMLLCSIEGISILKCGFIETSETSQIHVHIDPSEFVENHEASCIDSLDLEIIAFIGWKQLRKRRPHQIQIVFIGPKSELPTWIPPLTLFSPLLKILWEVMTFVGLMDYTWHIRIIGCFRTVLIHEWILGVRCIRQWQGPVVYGISQGRKNTKRVQVEDHVTRSPKQHRHEWKSHHHPCLRHAHRVVRLIEYNTPMQTTLADVSDGLLVPCEIKDGELWLLLYITLLSV